MGPVPNKKTIPDLSILFFLCQHRPSRRPRSSPARVLGPVVSSLSPAAQPSGCAEASPPLGICTLLSYPSAAPCLLQQSSCRPPPLLACLLACSRAELPPTSPCKTHDRRFIRALELSLESAHRIVAIAAVRPCGCRLRLQSACTERSFSLAARGMRAGWRTGCPAVETSVSRPRSAEGRSGREAA